MPTTPTWKRLTGIGGLMITSLLPSTQATFTPITRQAGNISWFACPDSETTQCAFFDVPMDYSNPNDNATISIFMRKFPAKVPAEQRLGTILTNPGGPGGSGSLFVEGGGEGLSTIVEGRYDIIGFDPRGVNLTGPSTACFDVESKFVHLAYQVQLHGAPFPHVGGNAERAHVTKLAAKQAAHPAACKQNGNHQVLQSVGTVAVAQDMARIVEALGEDGLNFWGYSYGTILGATFAAIRPDLVKRMVLDGVSNAESYFNDLLQWGRDGMEETHKTYEGFFSTCIEAGPKKCAFAAPKDGSNRNETVASLKKRLEAIYSKLSDQPLTVGDSLAGPGVITAADLQAGLLGILYTPEYWPSLAQTLVELEQGVGASAYAALYSSAFNIQPRPYNENVFNRSMQVYNTRESIFPILCGDSSSLNLSVNAYDDYLRELGKISPVGEQWGVIGGGCRGWPFQAKQRYTGPWTTKDGLKKTRFPILFLSLDADPVTPLSSAVKMNRGFGNESSTLLIQQGYGHCTIANPSLCTIKNVRDYFVDGKVPPNGTHCIAEPGFIYPDNSTSTKRAVHQLSKRDEELLGALDKLHHARTRLFPRGF